MTIGRAITATVPRVSTARSYVTRPSPAVGRTAATGYTVPARDREEQAMETERPGEGMPDPEVPQPDGPQPEPAPGEPTTGDEG